MVKLIIKSVLKYNYVKMYSSIEQYLPEFVRHINITNKFVWGAYWTPGENAPAKFT